MSAEDRLHWDAMYAQRHEAADEPAVPTDFRPVEHHFPATGRALDVACGAGGAAVWLARRGLEVWGLDISAVAIDRARERAAQWQVASRCRFDVADLDHGLPAGPPVDIVICHRFRAPHLSASIVDRLAFGGLFAVSVLSEVDAVPGRHRAAPGELLTAYCGLEPIASGEGHGIAWLLARKH